MTDDQLYTYGEALIYLIKAAISKPKSVLPLAGRLYKTDGGWLMLAIPNALVRGAFSALKEPGAELPMYEGNLSAHVSVMRPEELEDVGGADAVTERGKDFKYGINGIKSVNPAGWPENSRVWFLEVDSPELQKLRKTYGLSPLPQKDGHDMQFHITLATRKTNVLGENTVGKAAAYTMAPTDALDQIKQHGLLSGASLLNNPEALAAAAASRGMTPEDFKKEIDGTLAGWKPESSQGPNIVFQPPPEDFDMPEHHPTNKWNLSQIGIDLDKLLEDQPDTRVHGSELVPYDAAESERLGDDYIPQRHRDLSPEDLKDLRNRSAEELWQHMDKDFKGYAANVPHASVITPSGGIDPKYLKFGASDKLLQPQVNYRPAMTGQKCGVCKHFDGVGGCSLVDGLIYPMGTCDLWESAETPSFTGMDGPVKPEGISGISFGGIPEPMEIPKMARCTTAEVHAGWLPELDNQMSVKNAKHVPTVAVDLDGTIATHFKKFDDNSIPSPRPGVRKALKKFQDSGHRIIVFTVRGKDQLVKDYMHEHDIPFDYINENPDQPDGASDKVMADVYIDDRAIDGAQSWKKIQEQTVKELSKNAASAQENLMQMLVDPAISSWASQNGFVHPGMNTSGTLYERMRQQRGNEDMMSALQQAGQADAPQLKKLLQGVMNMTGRQWTPETDAWANKAIGNIAPIMPLLGQSDFFNKLTGGRTPLVSAIMSAHENSGMTPEMANQVADDVMQQIASDPQSFHGLDPGELGQMYYKMWQSGQLPGSADAATIAGSLKENAAWGRAMKDMGTNQGFNGNLGQMMNQTESMFGQNIQPGSWTPHDAAAGRQQNILSAQGLGQGGVMNMDPQRRAQWLREQNILARQGGDFAAGYRQTGGPKGFGSVGMGQLQKQHTNLMQNAYNSPMASQYGAIMRARDQFNLGPETPVGNLAAKIESGQAPSLSRAHLGSILSRSGVPRDQAASMMNQQFANSEYVGKYGIGDLVRGHQGSVDIQPMLKAQFGGMGKHLMSPEFGKVIHDPKQRTDWLAKRMGGDRMKADQLWGRANKYLRNSPMTKQYTGGLSQIHQLFGKPQLSAAGAARRQASQQAQTSGAVNPLQNTNMWSRIGKGVREMGSNPDRSTGDFLFKDVLGTVPKADIQKLAPGISKQFPNIFGQPGQVPAPIGAGSGGGVGGM